MNAAIIDADLVSDRSKYRALQASCARHDAKTFTDIARGIASELADGEDVLPYHYLCAARIICSGQDYA